MTTAPKWLMLPMLLAATACESERPLGKCVGLNGHEDTTLVYEYSATNIVIGVAFFEMVAPPILVALNELKCPIAKSDSPLHRAGGE